MARRPPITRTNERVTGKTTVAELANNVLLETLSGAELVVYLRLMAISHRERSVRVHARNEELHRHNSMVARVLRSLEDQGLVKVEYKDTDRTVELINK